MNIDTVQTRYKRVSEALQENKQKAALQALIPGLFVFTLVLIIAAKFTSPTAAMIESAAGGILIFFAGLFVFLKKTRIATLTVILFSYVIIGLFIFLTGITSGHINLLGLFMMNLLVLPVIVTGMLAGPGGIIISALLSGGGTMIIYYISGFTSAAQRALAAQHGPILIILPIAFQFILALILIAGSFGNDRLKQEALDWRVSYKREKELDQMREQFIASVNHELRNPIMAAQNYFILAKELGEHGDIVRQQKMLDRGAEVSQRLADIVESILSVRKLKSSAEDLDMIPVELKTFLEPIANVTELTDVNGKHPIKLAIPQDLAIMGDEQLLTEVFSNLLVNAVKYSPDGGEITVTGRLADSADLKRAKELVTLSPKEQYAVISVSDLGLGIPQDKISLIFEPFVRLDRDDQSKVKGSGLGLAIVKSHVQVMGGAIWVNSAGVNGLGSEFFVLLRKASL